MTATRMGFQRDLADLPTPRFDLPLERRERAARIVLAIAHFATPEDIVLGTTPEEVDAAFSRAVDLDEALTHVDLLLDALLPL